jgi:PAS domain S-box-containing protein
MQINILLVEDNPGDRRLIQEALKEPGDNRFQLDCTDRLATGIQKLGTSKPDAIILDLSLPDSQGLASFTRVHEKAPDVPIVVLTGLKDEGVGVQAVRAGAQDYLVKGDVTGRVLMRALLYGIERQRAEAAHAHLAAIVESSDDAIISATPDGTILSWNVGAERMFGYTAAEAIGQPVAILIPPDRQEELAVWEKGNERQNTPEHVETVRLHKDGRRIDVSQSLSAIKDGQGRVVGTSRILHDIGERKRTEEEVHRLNQDLERRVQERTAKLQEANRELEAFTYSVSHDLRAPLRHVDGYSKLLEDSVGAALPEEAQQYVGRVREATQRMGQMIEDLLNLSRLGRQELSLQMTSLNSLLEEVHRDLQLDLPSRAIAWNIGSLPSLECDPGLVRQVLTNLLSNAVKFTAPREHAVIEVGATVQDGAPVIFVRDNGVGFDMKRAQKLFGPFQRLHSRREFEGTGVGLATVRRIVDKHGGRVWAEAELDKGATFFFTLGAGYPRSVQS